MATPFTILTGFLGAGKTTTLNRLLSAPGGRKIAVLVNELGRISIDSHLILSRGGDVLELAGGCVCCKVGNDLWDGVADVIERSKPDHVVLETTGIAEPDAIIQGFERLPPAQRNIVSLYGIVCIVDADAGASQIARREEARLQVRAADRLMLSKLDLAKPSAAAQLHQVLQELNAGAERASFPLDASGTHAMVPWLLQSAGKPSARGGHIHRHSDGQLIAASISATSPLLAPQLLAMIDELGDRLLRVKGFVDIAGEDLRGFLELAGNQAGLRFDEPWPPGPRRTELVMIGEKIDEAALQRRLWSCRVGGGEEAVPF